MAKFRVEIVADSRVNLKEVVRIAHEALTEWGVESLANGAERVARDFSGSEIGTWKVFEEE